MAQIQAGHNYTPTGANSLVTASNLNQHVNNAQLVGGAISEQTNTSIVTGSEYVLIYNSSTGLLYKTQLTNLLLTGNVVNSQDIRSSSGVLNVDASILTPLGAIPHLHLTSGNGNTFLTGGNITISADNTYTTDEGILSLWGKEGVEISSGYDTTFYSPVVFENIVKLPVGTTAQRPATPEAGFIRYNSTLSSAETYNGTNWGSLAAIVDSSLTSNGYVKLANGLTLQWGTFEADGYSNNIPNPQIVPLPIEFSVAIVYANVSVDGADTANIEVAHIDWTTSGKTTKSQLGVYVNYGGPCKFFAIGY